MENGYLYMHVSTIWILYVLITAQEAQMSSENFYIQLPINQRQSLRRSNITKFFFLNLNII